MGGAVEIIGKVSPAMFAFGLTDAGIIDRRNERSMWEVEGKLIVRGPVKLGAGTRLSIDKGGLLDIGSNFILTGRSTLNAHQLVRFGQDCLLSWDILVLDTDYHDIFDQEGRKLNPSKPIIVGDHVWIGCRSTILKGVTIGNNVVVAANSTLVKSLPGNNCVIGGQGNQAGILKQNISWNK
jgi:acetyltransferase-like isoleucine patch superfamily enzyme